MISKDRHGELKFAQLVVGPSSNSVECVVGQGKVALGVILLGELISVRILTLDLPQFVPKGYRFSILKLLFIFDCLHYKRVAHRNTWINFSLE